MQAHTIPLPAECSMTQGLWLCKRNNGGEMRPGKWNKSPFLSEILTQTGRQQRDTGTNTAGDGAGHPIVHPIEDAP